VKSDVSISARRETDSGMKITGTQPLEEATPVVPETQATVEAQETPAPATPTATDGDRHQTDRHDRPPDEPDDAYPEPPAGSGGHP
jgi:hypothetical protein